MERNFRKFAPTRTFPQASNEALSIRILIQTPSGSRSMDVRCKNASHVKELQLHVRELTASMKEQGSRGDVYMATLGRGRVPPISIEDHHADIDVERAGELMREWVNPGQQAQRESGFEPEQ